MSDFKLIAMRPLNGCDKRFSKNLILGEVYRFYNDFHFIKKDDEVIEINYKQTTPEKLYDVLQDGQVEPISVNVSAVVGKNGSGKSTLLELLYLTVYVLSVKYHVLSPNLLSIESELQNTGPKDERRPFLERTRSEIENILESLKLEVYYSINDSIFCISINKVVKQNLVVGTVAQQRNYTILSILEIDEFNFEDFFYTVALNYSIHGLNSENLGDWINALFHKNDGYQTPIVINPFRDEGNFDINTENHLAQSRLLANLVDDSMVVKRVIGDKTVDKVTFIIKEKKLEEVNHIALENVIAKLEHLQNKSRVELFEHVYNAFTGETFSLIAEEAKNSKHFDLIVKYTIKKLVKIASWYDQYKPYYTVPKNGPLIPEVDWKGLINALITDHSHITLKLKQILNTVRFGLLKENNEKDIIWNRYQVGKSIEHHIIFPLTELIERIRGVKNDHKKIDVIELIPVAFFAPVLHIVNNATQGQESVSTFDALSSGEQQYVHAIQSILYHIIYLNSVFAVGEDDVRENKFHNVNILLDEVELYYHPELQRNMLWEVLLGLQGIRTPNIKAINILTSTHSPFILSDIPNQNILRVKEGNPQPYVVEEKTFGANIYDLLTNDFFMEDGYIGELAMRKIKDVLDYINDEAYNKERQDYFMKIVNIIAEEVIRAKLTQVLEEKIPPSDEAKIDRLKSIISQAEEELKKLQND